MKNNSKLYHLFIHPFSQLKKPRHMARCAMLLALSIIVAYLMSFYPSNYLKISFSFIFIAVAAMEYGPMIAAAIAAISDVICFITHPTGPYIPLLTLTTALGGFVVGLFLYKNKTQLWRIIVSRLIIVVFISTLIDTYILSMVYEKMYFVFLISRSIKNAIALPIEIILLFVVLKIVEKIDKSSNIQ